MYASYCITSTAKHVISTYSFFNKDEQRHMKIVGQLLKFLIYCVRVSGQKTDIFAWVVLALGMEMLNASKKCGASSRMLYVIEEKSAMWIIVPKSCYKKRQLCQEKLIFPVP